MRIASSDIQMKSISTLISYEQETERLMYWENDPAKVKTESQHHKPGVTLDLSDKAKELIGKNEETDLKKEANNADNAKNKEQQAVAQSAQGPDKADIREYWVNTKEEMTRRLIESFMTLVFGRKVKFQQVDFKPPAGNKDGGNVQSWFNILGKPGQAQPKPREETRDIEAGARWGVSYENSYERYEKEKMTFNAQGTVNTADGKQISFSLDLSMSRTLYERSYTAIEAGGGARLCDPLVINYAGPAADLSDTKFSFDLDADGTSDQISLLKSGSGFLALDKDADGKIDDGNELFGAQSGDGFGDLAKYDGDGNGWIDENDQIFDKLRVWVKDERGNDKLLALGQVGVGAIYLGNVDSKMGIVGSDGNANGQVAKTGIFLRENGLAGTVQHVDFAI